MTPTARPRRYAERECAAFHPEARARKTAIERAPIEGRSRRCAPRQNVVTPMAGIGRTKHHVDLGRARNPPCGVGPIVASFARPRAPWEARACLDSASTKETRTRRPSFLREAADELRLAAHGAPRTTRGYSPRLRASRYAALRARGSAAPLADRQNAHLAPIHRVTSTSSQAAPGPFNTRQAPAFAPEPTTGPVARPLRPQERSTPNRVHFPRIGAVRHERALPVARSGRAALDLGPWWPVFVRVFFFMGARTRRCRRFDSAELGPNQGGRE